MSSEAAEERLVIRPPNFRDVGDALGLFLDPSPIAPGLLLRGGKLDALTTLADIDTPRTILSLRRGADPEHLGATLLHVPADDTLENYDTGNRRVRVWVLEALAALAGAETPVYVHCAAGRDRTGVVVAAALMVLGVPADVIIAEYMLSDGANVGAITRAMKGLRAYHADLARHAPAVRAAFLR